MPADSKPFESHRSGGVRHRPEADIESIRDLLRGYGSSRSILKELIQNAEDARATHMDVIYLPEDPASKLQLLHGPGLLVVNNGEFKEEHRDAISQINLGTKGTEERAIGRFGKGLKSVFAWCEAFFIIASTDKKLGWPEPSITDLFNPWDGLRHQDWMDDFEEYSKIIKSKVDRELENLYPKGNPWLAFWFPLRCQAHAHDSKGEVAWIYKENDEQPPGDNPLFYEKLCNEFKQLVPSLVCLRNLRKISIINRSVAGESQISWSFPEECHRVPATDDPPGSQSISGKTYLNCGRDGSVEYRYYGSAGRLPDERVLYLKNLPDWPAVVHRDGDKVDMGCKAKGEPHFATLVAAVASEKPKAGGSLEMRWCVFFPVGSQPGSQSRIPLSIIDMQITINLHGFFFLDSERLRIDGLDEGFKNMTGRASSCVKWNEIVAKEGTFPHLPEALSIFAEQESLDRAQCEELSRTICQTWEWRTYRNEICAVNTWRPRWRNGNEKWECISSGTNVYEIPPIPNEIIPLIPWLTHVSESAVLVVRDPFSMPPGLYSGNASSWTDGLVLQLLRDVKIEQYGDSKVSDWVNCFLGMLHQNGALRPGILHGIASLPLILVSDVMRYMHYRISRAEWFSLRDEGYLFLKDSSKKDILYLLKEALPKCYTYHAGTPPAWTGLQEPKVCTSIDAAKIILNQKVFGNVNARNTILIRLAEAGTYIENKDVRLAMRLLLHGNVGKATDGNTPLFIQSGRSDNDVWRRVLQQLFLREGGMNSWQILEGESASVLNVKLQEELGVSQIDSLGILKELLRRHDKDIEMLEFPEDQWPAADLSILMEGLYNAGKSERLTDTLSLLRRLRLHVLNGKGRQRVSISDGAGNLAGKYVLDAPDFAGKIPSSLQALWTSFLGTANVIGRLPGEDLASTIQKHLFEKPGQDYKTYCVEINWNFVVRHAIESPAPSEWANLILQAFAAEGGQAATGLGVKLKETKWLPLELGGVVAPDSIVAIKGIEDDLLHLLDPAKDGIAGVLTLPEWIRKHKGFSSLVNFFPQPDNALDMLGTWLQEKPEWRLGLTDNFLPRELDKFLQLTKDIEELPIAALLFKLRNTKEPEHREGFDSLLKDSVLMSVLTSFDYKNGGLAKFKNILLKLQNHQGRLAFEAYLGQCCNDNELKSLLGGLSLVNQKDDWVPAEKLIWPSHNLNPAAQICIGQANLLNKLYASGKDTAEGGSPDMRPDAGGARIRNLKDVPDFTEHVKVLREYLKPFREGDVGENLPAALVAVLGGGTLEMRTLLEELLKARLRQKPDDFIENLLGDRHEKLSEHMKKTRFIVEVVKGENVMVPNLIGNLISVDLIDEIASLLIGDPGELWWRWTCPAHPEAECHKLRLRQIEEPDSLADPVEVFKNTIENILLQVHCNNLSAQCPVNIKEFLSEISDPGQTDLRRSQIYLMDIAEGRLKELGVKGAQKFDEILKEFDEARQKRVDAESFEKRSKSKAITFKEDGERLIKEARDKLKSILEAESADELKTQQLLVEAVRRKMKDYQYDIESVPLELFQNADDAVAELCEMKKTLLPEEQRFVLEIDEETGILQIIHWGRPINQYDFPGFKEGRNLGYHQDLEKMLTLNFSDKGVGAEEHKSTVTGYFGLGFKSVFLISSKPRVISGFLDFEIRGGFYPVALNKKSKALMREKALLYAGKDIRPTMVSLDWSKDANPDEVRKTVENFEMASPFLSVFSREIKTLTVVRNKKQSSISKNIERAITGSGQITNVKVGQSSYLCFRCPLKSDKRPATILLQLDAGGIGSLEEEIPRLWITTPTMEKSELGWALNAPFKPDAGRQRLALKNSDNCKLAAEVADKWCYALLELFDFTSGNWFDFANSLGLHSDASLKSWWGQLWMEMSAEKEPVLSWEGLKCGGQILGWITWAENTGAMRRFIQQRAAIPSKLPGSYANMLKLSDLKFWVDGVLSEIQNGSFNKIACWESFRKAFPAGLTVHRSIKDFLASVKCCDAPAKVMLEDALAAEIGERQRAGEETADRIGELIGSCDALFESRGQNAHEAIRILDLLKKTEFIAEDGYWHESKGLVCAKQYPGLVENDETLRAAFAPKSAVLSVKYSQEALIFFIKSREMLTANAKTMAEWAREASTEQLPSVFKYLVHGELSQQLADELKRDWLYNKKVGVCFQGLSEDDKSEIERKFLRGYKLPSGTLALPGEEADEPVMDSEEAFCKISDWWDGQMKTHVKSFEEKTYPAGFPGKLIWPGENGWEKDSTSAKTRWLLLFINAALVPLGLNKIGRDQGFLKFLLDNGWLEHLLKVNNPKERDALLNKLDEYFCSRHFIQNTQFHFQMRQFIAFYAMGRNLEEFLHSLKAAEQSDNPGVFRNAFSPNANLELTGTGITAPPLYGMLGIGSCQILRELYRLGRLRNPHGYRYAFTPLRKVRSLCEKLFGVANLDRGIGSSEMIFRKLDDLGSKSGKDATFNHCFDLPFLLLAEKDTLRKDVLSIDLNIATDDFDE
jgi:hypothetical protein